MTTSDHKPLASDDGCRPHTKSSRRTRPGGFCPAGKSHPTALTNSCTIYNFGSVKIGPVSKSRHQISSLVKNRIRIALTPAWLCSTPLGAMRASVPECRACWTQHNACTSSGTSTSTAPSTPSQLPAKLHPSNWPPKRSLWHTCAQVQCAHPSTPSHPTILDTLWPKSSLAGAAFSWCSIFRSGCTCSFLSSNSQQLSLLTLYVHVCTGPAATPRPSRHPGAGCSERHKEQAH